MPQKGRTIMPSLLRYSWRCLQVILESTNNREKINYSELAHKLNLKLARQEWHTVLDSVAWRTKRDVGYDLTWNVVYARGPAKGLGRYLSNGNKAPGSQLLDPEDEEQVAEYERTLQEIYEYTYELQRIDDEDRVVKISRPL
jgi:hypothetical protein